MTKKALKQIRAVQATINKMRARLHELAVEEDTTQRLIEDKAGMESREARQQILEREYLDSEQDQIDLLHATDELGVANDILNHLTDRGPARGARVGHRNSRW